MSMAIYDFIEYTVGVGAVVYAPPYKIALGSEKNEKRQRVIWTCSNVCRFRNRI